MQKKQSDPALFAIGKPLSVNGGHAIRKVMQIPLDEARAISSIRRAARDCRETGRTLHFATLGAFISDPNALAALIDARVAVRADDLPWLTEDHLPSLARAACSLRERRSAQIRAGLARIRAQGKRLGNPRLSEMHASGAMTHLPRAHRLAAESNRNLAAEFADRVESSVKKHLCENSEMTFSELAARLNLEGIAARRGGLWSASTVHRLCIRLGVRRVGRNNLSEKQKAGEFS